MIWTIRWCIVAGLIIITYKKKRLPNINSFEEDPCLFGDNDYNFWAKSHGTVLPFSIGHSLDPDIAKLRTK